MMAEPYRFSRFTLDPIERRLRADGAPVPIGSTSFNVLLALVERAGKVVSKDDLMSRVWGYSDVGDNRLRVHINILRKIVGKDCIVTKQGLGYRFQAQVQQSEREPWSAAEIQSGNIPSLWTADATDGPARLIGRSEELRSISELLERGRLVTLTGPGGVGKTRLALQAAGEASLDFSDGVWLADLAALKDPDLVPGAVASVLGIKIGQSASPFDTLARHLARRTLLVVIDNCEHLIGAVARLCETLMAAAPGVKILATSREALSCAGEQAFEVPPLQLSPDNTTPPSVMRGMAAVELFIERTRSVDAKYRMDDEEVVIAAKICRRVDGLPLAIEMVASWAGVLGLETLDEKLDGSLKAWLRARSTAPPRHGTLSVTLEWSHDLLSAAEQIVLRRLAACAGNFTLQAAEAVAADDVIPKDQVFEHLGSLVRKSMITVVPGSRSQRYHLLQTTRAFMLEKLAASDEAETVRRRHADYVLHSLDRALREWETTSDAVWLERYGPLLDDLRGALDWAMRQDAASDDAVALAGASWPLWEELALFLEGRQRLSAAAARLHSGTPPALEARLRRGLGELCLNTASATAAYEELARAAMLYRSLGEFPHCGDALARLGFALLILGRSEEAERAISEALQLLEYVGWPRTLATAYSVQLCIEATLGRFDAASAAGEKAARLCEMAGTDRIALVVAANLVEVSLTRGDVDGAISAGRDLIVRLGDTFHSDLRGFVLGILSAALTARGDLDEALTAAREAVPLLRDEGALFFWMFDHLALRACLAGHFKDAARVSGYADAIHRKFGRPREPIGVNAVERLGLVLRNALVDSDGAQLRHEGAMLNEGQAIALALRS